MGTTPYKTLSVRVRVCIWAKRAIVSAPLLSNDTSGTCSSENGQTNTHSLSPSSIFLFHTHTHIVEATGILCCIVGERERARSGSRPLHGTLERPNSGVPKRRGGGERGQGGKKTSRIKTTPNGMIVYMYPLWVWVCVDLFGEDGKLFTFDLFVSLPSAGR